MPAEAAAVVVDARIVVSNAAATSTSSVATARTAVVLLVARVGPLVLVADFGILRRTGVARSLEVYFEPTEFETATLVVVVVVVAVAAAEPTVSAVDDVAVAFVVDFAPVAVTAFVVDVL